MTKQLRGVYERNPGSRVFWIRYADASGKIRREKVGRKSDAIALLAKRKSEVLQRKKLPENFRAREASVADLCADALEYSRAEKKSFADDVSKAEFFKKEFGNRPAASITPQELSRWLDHQTRTPATRNRYRAFISMVYRQGIRNGRVTVNPARLVRQRRENNARLRFLSAEEAGKLRSIIEEHYPHHVPAFDVALNTGMRKSEQFRLTWADVSLERRSITLRDTKNGSMRHVPLNRGAVEAFQTAMKQWDGDPRSYVFQSVYGLALKNPRKWYVSAVQKAKLSEVLWHTLRHTFVSNLIMKGVDIRTVQELAGHKTITMTMRYAHLASSHTLEAVERLCDSTTPTDTTTDTSTFASAQAKSASALTH
jgi:site-specific recombinase XerD